MKFAKLLLFVFLSVVLNVQSSGAKDDEGEKTEASLRAAQAQVDWAMIFQDQEIRRRALFSAIDKFAEANEMTAGHRDLTGTDGQLLLPQIYACLGNAWQQVFDSISGEGCLRCQLQKVHSDALAGIAYFRAYLANGDTQAFKVKISTIESVLNQFLGGIGKQCQLEGDRAIVNHAQVIATMMRNFESIYAECAAGTGLTHVGIKTRFERFTAKCLNFFTLSQLDAQKNLVKG